MCFLANSTTDYWFECIRGNVDFPIGIKMINGLVSCIQARGVGKGANLYGPRSPLLEGPAMDTLVEVDGVFACYDIFQCATLTSLPQRMSCQPYDRWEERG